MRGQRIVGVTTVLKLLLIAGSLGLLVSLPSEAQESSAEAQARFVFGVGDVLTVAVWKDAELSAQVQVQPDGMISLPLVGEVKVAGLTPSEVQTLLEERYRRFVTAPGISVIVNQINSLQIYVIGEVSGAGAYDVLRPTTIMQALAMAGGFTEYAKKDQVLVIRHAGSSQQHIQVNIKAIISGRSPSDNILLQAGDTIVVP